MDLQSNIERIEECLHCEQVEYCCINISEPQDNVDVTCLTREILSMEDGKYDKGRTS